MMNLKGEYPPEECFSGLGGVVAATPTATGGRLRPGLLASAARVLEEQAEDTDEERERGGDPVPCPCPWE